MDDFRDALGARIRSLREARHWSQADLAERAGISTHYVGQIERGRRDPSLSVALAVARALGTSVDVIAQGEPGDDEAARLAFSAIPRARREVALRVLWALAEGEERLAAEGE